MFGLNFGTGDFGEMAFNFFVKLIVLFTALPFHEYAHAYVAHLLGDDTARNQGRLTLNPLVHLDIIGSIAILIFGFGWAKPVPINPYNFKNRKWGMAISSLAGPVANILLAFVFMLVFKIMTVTMGVYHNGFMQVLIIMISLNIGLAVFNLLPIPPLDGSRIATLFLPERIYFEIMRYERFIFIALILLINTPIFNVPMNFLTEILFNFLNFATSFIEFFAGM